MSRRASSVLRTLSSVALIILAVWVFVNRQYLIDQWAVINYTPSSEIEAIADRASLTGDSRFLLEASRTEIMDRNNFNQVCRSATTEKSAVLGCYVNWRIYLFNIDNPRLDGVKEVTAAHEVLHAAYDRMSDAERDRVDTLIAQQDLGNSKERIDGLMKEYARTEPGQGKNELHSIVGTEVATLSPELEEYYSRYFDDRSKLVQLSSKYISVFNELKERQDTIVQELDQLAEQINAKSDEYSRSQDALNSDIQSFNSRASSGSMTRAEYDSQRAVLASRRASLASEYEQIKLLIDQHNAKRNELIAINADADTLNRSINSSLTAPQEIE